jgi:hypothetical protein
MRKRVETSKYFLVDNTNGFNIALALSKSMFDTENARSIPATV